MYEVHGVHGVHGLYEVHGLYGVHGVCKVDCDRDISANSAYEEPGVFLLCQGTRSWQCRSWDYCRQEMRSNRKCLFVFVNPETLLAKPMAPTTSVRTLSLQNEEHILSPNVNVMVLAAAGPKIFTCGHTVCISGIGDVSSTSCIVPPDKVIVPTVPCFLICMRLSG